MKLFWKWHKIFWIAFTTIILLLALLYGSLRLATPWVISHPESVKKFLSQTFSVPTDFKQFTISWRVFGPTIKFQQLQLRAKEGEAPFVTIQRLEFRFSLARNIVSWDLYPRATLVSGIQLSMQEVAPEHWLLNGISLPVSTQSWYENQQLKQFFRFIYSQQFLRIKNTQLTVQFFQKPTYQLNNLQLKLRKPYKHSSLEGTVTLQQTAKLPIMFQISYDGTPLLNRDWDGDVHVQFAKLHVADWTQLFSLQKDWRIQKGDGLFSFWFQFKKAKLRSITSEFDATNVMINEVSTQKVFPLNVAKGVVSWQRDSKTEWNVRAAPLHLLFTDSNKVPFDSEVVFSKKDSPEKKSSSYELMIDQISIANISTLLHFFTHVSDTTKQWLQQLNPQGELHDIRLQFPTVNLAELQPSAISLELGFNKLTTNAYKNFPALKNFQGDIVFTPTKGQISFDNQDASIYFPTFFAQAIPLKDLVGSVEWLKKDNGIQIQAKNVLINNTVIQTKNDLRLFVPNDNSSPTINLQTSFSAEQLNGISHYLPVKVMNPKLATWLQHAIKRAKKVSGQMTLKGVLYDFPFDNGKGDFSVQVNLDDVSLAYWPQWPQVDKLSGTMNFHNRAMTIKATQGEISGAKLTTLTAVIPRMTKGETDWLSIHGETQGNLSSGIQFVQKTPMLMQKLGAIFSAMQGSGPMNLVLDLSIPLTSLSIPLRCEAKVALNKAQLAVVPWKLALQDITGHLFFTEKSFVTDHVTATLFDSPVTINVTTENTDTAQSKTIMQMDGHIALEKLQAIFGSQLSSYVKGNTDYHATLTVPYQSPASFIFEVLSDLQGVIIQLPTPFTKKANSKTPFRFALTTPKIGQTMLLTLSMINKWNALLLFVNEKEGKRLDKAVIQIGGKMPTLPSESGILLTGYMPKLPIDEWEKFAKQFSQHNPSAKSPLPFFLDMQTDQFAFNGMTIQKPRLQIETTATSKIISIDSQLVTGSAEIPNDPQSSKPIDVRLKRLVLNSNTTKSQPSNLTPDKIPNMRVLIEQFQYNNKNFGKVSFALSKQNKNTINIDNLVVTAPSLSILANGKWMRGSTEVAGNIRIGKLSRALKAWGLPPVMDSKQTDVKFNLNWSGSPISFVLAKLNGVFDLTMGTGSIQQLDPATEAKLGIGKLLSIISLQTLPRLFSFDFSAVTNKGFTFDKLTGRFQLNMGNAQTNNLEIDGPAARVVMKGRIGLAAEDYDVWIRINPHVTQGIPVVAAFAGGPIVGATALVVNQLIGDKVVGSIVSYSYTLKGSWQKPIIKESKESSSSNNKK